MDLKTAKTLVADDQRRSFPEMTDAEAVEYARDVVNPDTLDEPQSELGRAYALVLACRD